MIDPAYALSYVPLHPVLAGLCGLRNVGGCLHRDAQDRLLWKDKTCPART